MTDRPRTSASPLATTERGRASLSMPHRGLWLLFGVLLALGAPAAMFAGVWRTHVVCDRAVDPCIVRHGGGSTYHWYVREAQGLLVEDRGEDGLALVFDGGANDHYVAGGPDRAPLDAAAARFAAFLRDPAMRTVDVSAGHPAELWIALASALLGFVLLAFGFRRTTVEVDPVAARVSVVKRMWPLVAPTLVERLPLADVVGVRVVTNVDGADKLALLLQGGGLLHVHTGLSPQDPQRVARLFGVDPDYGDGRRNRRGENGATSTAGARPSIRSATTTADPAASSTPFR